MSWSPDLFIGELRPWPDTVHVVRGRTDETRRYVPERTCREVKIRHHWRGCSECGYIWDYMYGIGKGVGPRFCPMCGARVVTA